MGSEMCIRDSVSSISFDVTCGLCKAAGVREHDPHCTSIRFLYASCCTRQKPIPNSLDASVRRIVVRAGLKGFTIVFVVNFSFTSAKSFSCSGNHAQAVPFFSRSLIRANIWDKSGMNDPSC